MATEIKKVNDTTYTVNDKTVYQDSNSNWVAQEELTEREFTDFRKHRKLEEDNRRYYTTKK